MKKEFPISDFRFPIERPRRILRPKSIGNRQSATGNASGFTMVEIAISLAIIGIALVAIIGVLPIGMNVQKENRESTVVNQDASVFMEAIRSGARGLDDLTNYVYAITNDWTLYNKGVPSSTTPNTNGYDYLNASVGSGYPKFGLPTSMNHGSNIVGLLSTPEFINADSGLPSLAVDIANGNYISNHITAYVRSISGPAFEKPPQNNDILQQDSFSYHILCVNTPMPVDTNIFNLPTTSASRIYADQLTANLHELRLTFLWPQLSDGKLGPGRQTFRATIAGQLQQFPANNNLYFYQSQSFVADTNAP